MKLLAYRVFDPTVAPLLAKKAVDGTPQTASRAYGLYERVDSKGRFHTQWGHSWPLPMELVGRRINKAEQS